jgi:UDP-N-acetyl-D-mannosaminuronate dehydrogenase
LCRVAEAAKLLENIFRSVNIELVNGLKLVYGAIDIDIWEVIEAPGRNHLGSCRFIPALDLAGTAFRSIYFISHGRLENAINIRVSSSWRARSIRAC